MDIKYLKIREILASALDGKNESSPTRKAVAEELKISQAYISQILNGKRSGSLEVLIEMAKIAGVGHLIDEGLKIEIDDETTPTVGSIPMARTEIIRKNEPELLPPSGLVQDLLNKTRTILESDNHWSETLSKNIEIFYRGICDRRKSDQPEKIPEETGDRRKLPW